MALKFGDAISVRWAKATRAQTARARLLGLACGFPCRTSLPWRGHSHLRLHCTAPSFVCAQPTRRLRSCNHHSAHPVSASFTTFASPLLSHSRKRPQHLTLQPHSDASSSPLSFLNPASLTQTLLRNPSHLLQQCRASASPDSRWDKSPTSVWHR